uniref:Variant surface glycoprotein n=1 Tax=Trypanosoma brucei TaxID=5691 RepID=A0A1V0FY28_9TRYP|nr:variant surface glycoprotein [Trypanosoma brucei]
MLIVAVTLAISLLLMGCQAAGPAKGENKKIFGLLCGIVLAADEEEAKVQLTQPAAEAAANAPHLALYLKQPAAIQQLASLAKQRKLDALEEANAPPPCKADKLAACKEAAVYFSNLPEAQQATLAAAAADERGFKTIINATALAIVAAASKAEPATQNPATATAKHLLLTAVYGTEASSKSAKLLGTGSTRQHHCGTGQTAPGKSAEQTISATIACLCASDATSTTNKGCYSTPTTTQSSWNSKADIDDWATIVTNCKKAIGAQPQLTAANLIAVHKGIKADLYTPKGTTPAVGFLGHKAGAANGDCDGDDGAAKGACASFATSADAVKEPTWLDLIPQAAAALDAANTKTKNVLNAEAEIHALNKTLSTLLSLNSMQALKMLPSIKQSTDTQESASKKQQEEAEAECNKKEKESDFQNPCTWNADEKEPRKKCTLSKEQKAAIE